MKGKSGYLKWGLTIFLTVCAILVFYDTFYMSGALQRLLSKLASILSPVLVGLVMAYLLAPIVNWFEKLILSGLHRIKRLEGKTIPHAAGWLRAVSILLTWAIVLLLLYLMFSVVIPQLIDSVVMLINNAGCGYLGRMGETETAVQTRMVDLNVTAGSRTCWIRTPRWRTGSTRIWRPITRICWTC